MALQFRLNPSTGQLDYVDIASSSVSKYIQTFNATSDWVLNVDTYELTVLQTTHTKGTSPSVDVFEFVADYELVNVSVRVNTSGDVIIGVPSNPDARFMGKLLIY